MGAQYPISRTSVHIDCFLNTFKMDICSLQKKYLELNILELEELFKIIEDPLNLNFRVLRSENFNFPEGKIPLKKEAVEQIILIFEKNLELKGFFRRGDANWQNTPLKIGDAFDIINMASRYNDLSKDIMNNLECEINLKNCTIFSLTDRQEISAEFRRRRAILIERRTNARSDIVKRFIVKYSIRYQRRIPMPRITDPMNRVFVMEDFEEYMD